MLVFLAPAGESEREAGEGEKTGRQGRGREGEMERGKERVGVEKKGRRRGEENSFQFEKN